MRPRCWRAAAQCITDIYSIQLPPANAEVPAIYNVGMLGGGTVVNAIAPAAATHKGAGATVSEGYKQFIANCPMRRQGDPEWDMGPLAWFLCSDACRYITGHTFMADGGAFMWA